MIKHRSHNYKNLGKCAQRLISEAYLYEAWLLTRVVQPQHKVWNSIWTGLMMHQSLKIKVNPEKRSEAWQVRQMFPIFPIYLCGVFPKDMLYSSFNVCVSPFLVLHGTAAIIVIRHLRAHFHGPDKRVLISVKCARGDRSGHVDGADNFTARTLSLPALCYW